MNAMTGEIIHQIPTHMIENEWTPILQLIFSPDGKTLVGVGQDQLVRLWDVATGVPLRSLAWHPNQTLSAAFSADGQWLAVGGRDQTVRYWDFSTGERGEKDYADGPVYALALWPDGSAIGTGPSSSNYYGSLDITEGNSGFGKGYADFYIDEIIYLEGRVIALRLPESIPGDSAVIHCNLMTNDCQEIAKGNLHGLATLSNIFIYGENNLIRTETGQILCALGEGEMVASVVGSGDGKMLAVGSTNGTVHVWQIGK